MTQCHSLHIFPIGRKSNVGGEGSAVIQVLQHVVEQYTYLHIALTTTATPKKFAHSLPMHFSTLSVHRQSLFLGVWLTCQVSSHAWGALSVDTITGTIMKRKVSLRNSLIKKANHHTHYFTSHMLIYCTT